jgi:hypothetical protein
MKHADMAWRLACVVALLLAPGCARKQAQQAPPAERPLAAHGEGSGSAAGGEAAAPPASDAGTLAGTTAPHAGPAGGGAVNVTTAPGTSANSAAGVQWTVPKSWTMLPGRPMRVASYGAPAAAGDPEGGECAVFFFGPGQGGPVQENINRWVGQFESPSAPRQSTQTVNGLKVSSVQVTGAYLAPSGPMMQSTGTKPNYELLGAIVEAPQGNVFFKLTGPRNTLDAAKGDFDRMLASLKAQ